MSSLTEELIPKEKNGRPSNMIEMLKFMGVGLIIFLLVVGFIALMLYLTKKDDACKNINCGVNGICKNGVCVCSGNWTGKNCELPRNLRFL